MAVAAGYDDCDVAPSLRRENDWQGKGGLYPRVNQLSAVVAGKKKLCTRRLHLSDSQRRSGKAKWLLSDISSEGEKSTSIKALSGGIASAICRRLGRKGKHLILQRRGEDFLGAFCLCLSFWRKNISPRETLCCANFQIEKSCERVEGKTCSRGPYSRYGRRMTRESRRRHCRARDILIKRVRREGERPDELINDGTARSQHAKKRKRAFIKQIIPPQSTLARDLVVFLPFPLLLRRPAGKHQR